MGASLLAVSLFVSRMETCRTKSEVSLLVQQSNVNRLEKIEEWMREHKIEVKAGMDELRRIGMEQASRTQTVKTTDDRFRAIEDRVAIIERKLLTSHLGKSTQRGPEKPPARSSAP